MRVMVNGEYTPEYLAERAAVEKLKEERGETIPFVVGGVYQTVGGGTVTCTELRSETPGYETALFDDSYIGEDGEVRGFRYNRDGIDRGRVTGTPFDHSHPLCVIPISKLKESV